MLAVAPLAQPAGAKSALDVQIVTSRSSLRHHSFGRSFDHRFRHDRFRHRDFRHHRFKRHQFGLSPFKHPGFRYDPSGRRWYFQRPYRYYGRYYRLYPYGYYPYGRYYYYQR